MVPVIGCLYQCNQTSTLYIVGAAPWDGVGVLNKKETTDIFKLAKMIGLTSDDRIRAAIFEVQIKQIF